MDLLSAIPQDSFMIVLTCLFLAGLFTFINGFHDTANSVATVIYTRTMPAWVAVVWTGIMNFLGVLFGGWLTMRLFGGMSQDGAATASNGIVHGIVQLMPADAIAQAPAHTGIALALAFLLSAVLWNLGTWYFGIPCSSTHTLIGALLGAGFAFTVQTNSGQVNWNQAGDTGASLLISPLYGFSLAVLLMVLLQSIVHNNLIFKEPAAGDQPPRWIRWILILTSTLVSFVHGSNDGQKNTGLLMLVLICCMPVQFARPQLPPVSDLRNAGQEIGRILDLAASGSNYRPEVQELAAAANTFAVTCDSLTQLKQEEAVRPMATALAATVQKSMENGHIEDVRTRRVIHKALERMSPQAPHPLPARAPLAIALLLGLGTMIGWKRIVVTVGEKIGKSPISYAQGASAELCAAATIGVSTGLGLPVSTTHVLSSAVAGAMVSQGGIQNLRKSTIMRIIFVWLLTLPMTFLLGGLFFWVFNGLLR